MNNPLYEPILLLCKQELAGLVPSIRIEQLAHGYAEHVMFALEKFKTGAITHDDSDILTCDLETAIDEEEADRLNYRIFQKVQHSLEALKK